MAAETLTVQDQGFYLSDGTKIEGAVAKGVTISKYQNQAGPIDWDAMKADGVTFAMGEANTDDAVLCNGQTVALPADRTYTKLYVLASAVEEPRTAEFRVGDRTYEAEVPLWKGFYGQWGWYGNSEGFMQRAKIGYLGTHRHQTDLGNVPYGFSYMYLLTFDIPEGATTVTLPKDKKVLVYAMTASNNPIDDVKLASRTFVRPDER